MIRSLSLDLEGKLKTELSNEEISAALQDPQIILWVDIEGEPPEKAGPLLLNTFGFHPLAVDDAIQETHVPKLDDWDAYLYIVLHTVSLNSGGDDRLETYELDLFAGSNYLVTHHDENITAVDKVWDAMQRDTRYLKNEIERLLYRVVDEVISSYMPVMEAIDDAIDRVETQIFRNPTSQTLSEIFALKRAILGLRRFVGPQREVLNKLARDEYVVIDEEMRIYFRDVYDHLVRLFDIVESIRDLISGVLDTYLSVINNRMNEVMKILTIITTVFMPVSFLASFFGMNFFAPVFPLTDWTGPLSFYLTLGVTIIVPVSMFVWMRRRGWM